MGENIKWVQCDGNCNRWFHMVCVGITKIRKKEKYLCNNCGDRKENEDEKETDSENGKVIEDTIAMELELVDESNIKQEASNNSSPSNHHQIENEIL